MEPRESGWPETAEAARMTPAASSIFHPVCVRQNIPDVQSVHSLLRSGSSPYIVCMYPSQKDPAYWAADQIQNPARKYFALSAGFSSRYICCLSCDSSESADSFPAVWKYMKFRW